MIRAAVPGRVEQQLTRALLESDRRYFELGAEVCALPGGSLYWMTGLNELAASCVVQRVDPPDSTEQAGRWLDQIEGILAGHRIPRARIYLDEKLPLLENLFVRRGYVCRGELGFLAPLGHPPPTAAVRLCRVHEEVAWQQKLALHTAAMEGPDGYLNQADLWVDMERRKCETGGMQTYLVYRRDQVVATVGTIVGQGLLRLKNIVVAPQYRRQGIALAIVHDLWRMAETEHGSRLGVFGVTGGKGSNLYRRAGLQAVTEQYEWSKLLSE